MSWMDDDDNNSVITVIVLYSGIIACASLNNLGSKATSIDVSIGVNQLVEGFPSVSWSTKLCIVVKETHPL